MAVAVGENDDQEDHRRQMTRMRIFSCRSRRSCMGLVPLSQERAGGRCSRAQLRGGVGSGRDGRSFQSISLSSASLPLPFVFLLNQMSAPVSFPPATCPIGTSDEDVGDGYCFRPSHALPRASSTQRELLPPSLPSPPSLHPSPLLNFARRQIALYLKPVFLRSPPSSLLRCGSTMSVQTDPGEEGEGTQRG